MLKAKEMARFLGSYLDKFKGIYYQPMAVRGLKEYIKSTGLGIAIDEWDYQSLPQSGIGRPKQADLTLVDSDGVLQSLVELQIAYDRSYDVRRLVYDLIKLESVEGGSHVSRFLVIVGERTSYDNHFKHDSGQRGRQPRHKSILPFDHDRKKFIELTTILPYSHQLLSEYSQKLKVGIPEKIVTTLVAEYLSPFIGLGVWEVNRQAKRPLIPENYFVGEKLVLGKMQVATA
jgi:hypothetical protein